MDNQDHKGDKISYLSNVKMADFLIQINLKEDTQYPVSVKHMRSGRGCQFAGLPEAILFMQDRMDEINYPQNQMEQRSWNVKSGGGFRGSASAGENFYQDDSPTLKGGLTFLIQVKFRQNATWQGKVQWVEQKREQSFRSVLELMGLLAEAQGKAKQNGLAMG